MGEFDDVTWSDQRIIAMNERAPFLFTYSMIDFHKFIAYLVQMDVTGAVFKGGGIMDMYIVSVAELGEEAYMDGFGGGGEGDEGGIVEERDEGVEEGEELHACFFN